MDLPPWLIDKTKKKPVITERPQLEIPTPPPEPINPDKPKETDPCRFLFQ